MASAPPQLNAEDMDLEHAQLAPATQLIMARWLAQQVQAEKARLRAEMEAELQARLRAEMAVERARLRAEVAAEMQAERARVRAAAVAPGGVEEGEAAPPMEEVAPPPPADQAVDDEVAAVPEAAGRKRGRGAAAPRAGGGGEDSDNSDDELEDFDHDSQDGDLPERDDDNDYIPEEVEFASEQDVADDSDPDDDDDYDPHADDDAEDENGGADVVDDGGVAARVMQRRRQRQPEPDQPAREGGDDGAAAAAANSDVSDDEWAPGGFTVNYGARRADGDDEADPRLEPVEADMALLERARDRRFRITYGSRRRQSTPVQSLQEHMPHFDFIRDLAPCVLKPGFHVLSSAPQSNKNIAESGIAIASKIAELPCAMIVGDRARNMASLAKKMNLVLRHNYDIEVVAYGAGQLRQLRQRAAAALAAEEAGERVSAMNEDALDTVQRIKRGSIMPLVLGSARSVQRFRELVQRLNIGGMTLILDESDYMWSSDVPILLSEGLDAAVRSMRVNRGRMVLREYQLYKMIMSRQLRSLVQVSATHMATLKWHTNMGAPYRAEVADRARLQSAGYRTTESLVPLKDAHGRPVWLDSGTHCASGSYNLYSVPMQMMARAYRDSPLPYRLLMVAITNLIHADGKTNAHVITEHLVEAVTKDGVAPVGLVVFDKGVNMLVDGEWLERPKADIGDVLDEIDLDPEFGPERPVIVVGMGCLQRCVSLRSSRRVITHCAIAPTKGVNTGDLVQLTARFCGNMAMLRQARGEAQGDGAALPPVQCLMMKNDYETVMRLERMTEVLLRACGTGEAADVDRWMAPELYEEDGDALDVYRALLSTRRHSRPKLRVSDDLQPAIRAVRQAERNQLRRVVRAAVKQALAGLGVTLNGFKAWARGAEATDKVLAVIAHLAALDDAGVPCSTMMLHPCVHMANAQRQEACTALMNNGLLATDVTGGGVKYRMTPAGRDYVRGLLAHVAAAAPAAPAALSAAGAATNVAADNSDADEDDLPAMEVLKAWARRQDDHARVMLMVMVESARDDSVNTEVVKAHPVAQMLWPESPARSRLYKLLRDSGFMELLGNGIYRATATGLDEYASIKAEIMPGNQPAASMAGFINDGDLEEVAPPPDLDMAKFMAWARRQEDKARVLLAVMADVAENSVVTLDDVVGDHPVARAVLSDDAERAALDASLRQAELVQVAGGDTVRRVTEAGAAEFERIKAEIDNRALPVIKIIIPANVRDGWPERVTRDHVMSLLEASHTFNQLRRSGFRVVGAGGVHVCQDSSAPDTKRDADAVVHAHACGAPKKPYGVPPAEQHGKYMAVHADLRSPGPPSLFIMTAVASE